MSRTNLYGPKDFRVIEVRLYTQTDDCHYDMVSSLIWLVAILPYSCVSVFIIPFV